MIQYYSINGELTPKSDANIHVHDLGLLRGYSIFDFFKFLNFKPRFIEDHLNRFYTSAALMDLTVGYTRTELKAIIQELIKANQQADGYMRIVLTGGYANNGFTPEGKGNLILLQQLVTAYQSVDSIKLMTHPFTRESFGIKTTNYAYPIALQKKMRAAAVNDVLYYDKLGISECSRMNFFIVKPNQTIVTTAQHVLEGITRKYILKVAEPHYNIEIRPIQLEELKTAQEAFVTSSTKGTLAVSHIDGNIIGDGKTGPITHHLLTLYDAHVKETMEA